MPTKIKKRVSAKKQALSNMIFSRFQAQNPEPIGELNYNNPYTLLVAVALSAQATDISVNKATTTLFEKIQHPRDMLKLGEKQLIEHIKSIGLYKSKANNLMKMAALLLERHDGEVPKTHEALEALPGVGRKTANVVLNIAFGFPTIAVDTHLFRLSHRLGLSKGKTPLAVELDLLNIIDAKYLTHAHHWLILHGRYICKARKPICEKCLLNDLCPSSLL